MFLSKVVCMFLFAMCVSCVGALCCWCAFLICVWCSSSKVLSAVKCNFWKFCEIQTLVQWSISVSVNSVSLTGNDYKSCIEDMWPLSNGEALLIYSNVFSGNQERMVCLCTASDCTPSLYLKSVVWKHFCPVSRDLLWETISVDTIDEDQLYIWWMDADYFR